MRKHSPLIFRESERHSQDGYGRTSNIQHRTSNTEHPTPNIQHPTSNIQHPTSNIQHPTSNIQHPTSNIQHPTSNAEHRTRCEAVLHWGLDVRFSIFFWFGSARLSTPPTLSLTTPRSPLPAVEFLCGVDLLVGYFHTSEDWHPPAVIPDAVLLS